MARIRTVKPEFWEDELVASHSRDARLLFIATWNLADDEGRLRWSAPYIKAKVFPYDEDLSVKHVAELMSELERSGRVLPYVVTETITQTFAVVVNFARHQRINRAQDSALPPPPPDGPGHGSSVSSFIDPSVNGTCTTNDPAVSDQPAVSVGSAPERKGRERKGRERKGKEGSKEPSAPLPETFPDFWAAYPRKVDKRIAIRAYGQALKRGAPPDLILTAAKAYAASQRNTEMRFIKHPSSWLNAGAYENPAEPLRLVSGGNPGGYQPWQNPASQDDYDTDLLPGGDRG